MELSEILRHCDHTLLNVSAGADEIKQLCDEAIQFNCASVCIPPAHVPGAKRYVGDAMEVCTVIGFPNGYSTPKVKAYEAMDAIMNGADEIDMVINNAMVKDGCWDEIFNEIRSVRQVTEDHILKVIIETCLLDEMEKKMLCSIVSTSGADYIKTSTGFSTGGATREDVKLLRQCCPAEIKIKAAGGIATIQDAEDFILLGADRIGTSRLVRLAQTIQQSGNI